jgi:hypothetical protein
MMNAGAPAQKRVLSPACIGHIGIRTTPDKFESMVEWHLNFFGGHCVLRNEKAAFIG